MKCILVTGGSRGIGRATSLLAAQRGWSVAISYRDDARAAKATVAQLEGAGVRATAIRADVAVEADVLALFAGARACWRARRRGGQRRYRRPEPAARRHGLGAVAPGIRRQCDGSYLCAREAARCLPRDRGGQGGAIVLVSSAAARLGSPFEFVDYAGSKAALDTLAVGLARELAGQGVRVNAVRPGLIDTEIHASGGQPDRAAPRCLDADRKGWPRAGGGRGDRLALKRHRLVCDRQRARCRGWSLSLLPRRSNEQRLGHDLNPVPHRHAARSLKVRDTANVGRDNTGGIALCQRGELAFSQFTGDLGLQNRVGARRAAAQVGIADRRRRASRARSGWTPEVRRCPCCSVHGA